MGEEYRPTVALFSDDHEWITAAAKSLVKYRLWTCCYAGDAPCSTTLTHHNPAVVVFGCRDLGHASFRLTLAHVQSCAPGVPTIACTVLQPENLTQLAGIVVSQVLSISVAAPAFVAAVDRLANSVDMASMAHYIRQCETMKHSVRTALSHALLAEPPVRTVLRLSRAAGVPEPSLRRDYHVVAARCDVSLPALLHAIALSRVSVHRSRGMSLEAACRLAHIDYRTATHVVRRISPSSLKQATANVSAYRAWFEDVVRRITSDG